MEPKTKKMWVIQQVDVPDDYDVAYLTITKNHRVIAVEIPVELIPGELVIEQKNQGDLRTIYIDPPPEPESLESVLERMPDHKAYSFAADGAASFRQDTIQYFRDLKEARINAVRREK